MKINLPSTWQAVIGDEVNKPYFKDLESFVDEERKHHTIYPPEDDVFNSFNYAPFDKIKVVLIGQDPYPGPKQAHGLCFSVRPGVRIPGSLKNIFKELHEDVGCNIPNNGYLVPWAEQGMLMLNAVLTVRAGKPNSHQGKGWEKFTDAAIQAVNGRDDPAVFVLWGNYAQKKGKHIDEDKHIVIKSAHPSPLSVSKFFGSRPFSKVNEALKKMGKEEIDWQIPDIEK